jgi:hypothetical protein
VNVHLGVHGCEVAELLESLKEVVHYMFPECRVNVE